MKRKKFYQILGSLLLLALFTTASFAQGETCNEATEITEYGSFTVDALTGTGAIHSNATSAAWYVITFTEYGFLSVNSCQGGTDTRLWILSGTCDSLTDVDDNDDACPHAPDGTGNTYASRLDNIPVSPGNYYIEWDDRWSADGFTFNVEFLPLPEYDLTLVKDNFPYRMLPYSQIPETGIDLEAIIRNDGANPMTDITVNGTIFYYGEEVFSETSDTIPMLTSLTSDTVLITQAAPPDETDLTFELSTRAAETAEDTTNNYFSTNLSYHKTYALEDGQTGFFGYGGSGGILTQGQKFSFYNNDTLHSISYYISGGQAADVISVEIFAMVGDSIGASLYSSGDIGGLFPAPTGKWWNYEFPNGFPVTAGSSYFIAFKSNQTGGEYLGLGTNNRYFYPGNAKFKTASGNWTPLEEVVEASMLIRPNTGNPTRGAQITVDMSNEVVADSSAVFFMWMTSQDQETPFSAPMKDNGDGTWTIDTTFSVFDTIYYLFSNGAGEDGNVEPFENLAQCGIAFAEDDDVYTRFIPSGFASYAPETVCFGSCGNCSDHAVTLTVNMSLQEVAPDGVFLLHTSNPAEDNEPLPVPMIDNGDGTWSTTIEVQDIDPLYYLFSNGHPDSTNTAIETGITATCGYEIDEIFYVRYIPSVTEDMNLDTVCFNTCGICEMHDITLTVDMTNEAEDLTDTVFVAIFKSLFFDDEDEDSDIINLVPMTDNGDNTWSTTYPVLDGTNVYYVFTNGNPYLEGEAEEVPDACSFQVSDSIDLITLRYVTDVTDSDTIPTVCYNHCTLCPPSNDECYDAMEITALLGQGADNVQSTGIVTNQYATISENDPADGYDCFYLGDTIQNNVWFYFAGDGYEYHFETTECEGITNYNDDTQMVIYSGECNDLTPEGCNEDIDFANDNYASGLDFETVAGTDYYIMIDGYNSTEGEFCLEVTQFALPTSNVTFNVNMAKEATVEDTIYIAGSFNGWSDTPMTNNGDLTYSFTTALTVGDTIQYKFKNGHNGWEDGIPADCSLGGFGNRYVVVDAADMDIDLVCFTECIDCTVGINDPAFELGFKIYPNPTTGITNIDFNFDNTADLTIKLMNNLGQTVRVETLNNVKQGSHRLNLTNVAKGIYNLQITRGDEILNKQLIID